MIRIIQNNLEKQIPEKKRESTILENSRVCSWEFIETIITPLALDKAVFCFGSKPQIPDGPESA